MNKVSAKCLVLKRLGNEHVKWADTPKTSSKVIAVLNILVASKPLRRLRSEIHPSHKLSLYSGYFALPRACAGNGFEFVNRCLCTYSQWQIRHDTMLERGVANSKKFIYTNVKIDKSKRENQLYFQSCKTGKSLCSL